MASKLDGSYVLVQVNGTALAGQLDSSMSFDAESKEVVINGGRFTERIIGRISYGVDVSLLYDDATFLMLYNIFRNGTPLTIKVGGVNPGDLYLSFTAFITSLPRQHPMSGLSLISLTLQGSGEPTYGYV